MLQKHALPISRRAVSWAALGLCLVLYTSTTADATQVAPLSFREIVRQADAIVQGTVTNAQSRWGDSSRRWMETEYTLAVEDVLYPSERGEPIGAAVTLTYWGGAIDGERQGIAGQRLPAVGERVIVFLRSDRGRESLSPIVGFNQGLFTITPDAVSGTPSVRQAIGQGLALSAGQVVLRGSATADAPMVSLVTLADWLRATIASVKAGPAEARSAVDPNDPRLMRIFAKTPLPISLAARETLAGSLATLPTRSPLVDGAAVVPTEPSGLVAGSRALPESSQAHPSYISNHQAYPPIVVNNFPDSFAPWSPEDEFQMSKWNYYANELFRVFTTPTGSYGFPDGIFDLAGWPSSADLQYVYGRGWADGEFGTTFLRWNNSGFLVEADIALNPAEAHTLDDEWVFNGSPAIGFRQLLMHELGHMHGLEHENTSLSLTNDMQLQFRAFGLPYMDDAAGVRAEYPSLAVGRTDLAVYLYHVAGFKDVDDATYPTQVLAGGNLTVNDYHVENAGTTTISAPTIEWYLTSARHFNLPYYYLGVRTFGPLPPFYYFTTNLVQATFVVPVTVPPGLYYLAAYIRNDGGASQASFPFSNNVAFSRLRIQVVSVLPPVVETWAAYGIGQTGATLIGSVNPNGGTTTTAFDYGPTTAYGSSVSAQTRSGTAFTSISASLSLACGTLYHYRARGTNSAGTRFGADVTFSTLPCLMAPSVFTDAATNIGQTSAVLTGEVNPRGGLTTTAFDYGPTTAYGNSVSAQTLNGTGGLPISASVSISCGTLYHFRARATNSLATTLGGDVTFTSVPCPAMTQVSPSGVRRGQSNRNISLTGQFTHFVQGQTTASFGAGVTVHSTLVQSATQAIATVTIESNAALGPRNVRLTTGGEVVTLSGGFSITSPPVPSGDFDGDRAADITVYRPSTGAWHTMRSTSATPTVLVWGNSTDKPVHGDYDGDGRADIAAFRPTNGSWYIVPSTTGVPYGLAWGNSADVPVPGDYDGDSKTDIAVFRPSTGVWYVRPSMSGIPYAFAWGNGTDLPVPGDYDDDGRTDLAVFRPTTGAWHVMRSSTGTPDAFAWGNGTDKPVAADYDGDGRTDVAVFRPSNGTWYVVRSSTSMPYAFTWGNATDVPVPADYDGDGKIDIAVFRPSNGRWFVIPSTTGASYAFAWGNGGDIPIFKRP